MKIIKEKETNEVVYAGNYFTLSDESGLKAKTFKASNIKPDNHELIEVLSIPNDFKGRHYTYINSVWERTLTGAEEAKVNKLAELADLRWQKETAGIDLDGAQIRTDRVSQGLITGAAVTVILDPTTVIDWKGVEGFPDDPMSADEVKVMAKAVSDHVQACFTREKQLIKAIGLDIDTDINAGWL